MGKYTNKNYVLGYLIAKCFNEHEMKLGLEEFLDEQDFLDEQKVAEVKDALKFAQKEHARQRRLNEQPFIVHPLFVAYFGIMLGIRDENIICIALLHDVCEDCGIAPEELPFNEVVQRGVRHLTFVYDYKEDESEAEKMYRKTRAKMLTYTRLIDCIDALIIKAIDRFHNLVTAAGELPEKAIIKNVKETQRYLLPIIHTAKDLEKYAEYRDLLLELAGLLRIVVEELALAYEIDLDY